MNVKIHFTNQTICRPDAEASGGAGAVVEFDGIVRGIAGKAGPNQRFAAEDRCSCNPSEEGPSEIRMVFIASQEIQIQRSNRAGQNGTTLGHLVQHAKAERSFRICREAEVLDLVDQCWRVEDLTNMFCAKRL